MENRVPPSTSEEIFTRLYLEAFPAVAGYISKTGGDLNEARDIFQEALLVYYEKIWIDRFEPKSSDKAYLLGIVRNRWLKRKEQKDKTRTSSIDSVQLTDVPREEPITEKLLLFLQETGQKCMEILQACYYDQLSMAGISKRFGFSSERSATVQKFKCLEKVRGLIKEKSLVYEDFIERN